MDVYRMGELWRQVYEFGNRVGESWRHRYELGKQADRAVAPKCAYRPDTGPDPYTSCELPVEYCETEPVSADTYELRLYWLCRQHAQLRDAEEEWGDNISDLLEWERMLDEARKAETKEGIITLLQRRCDERRRLCDEFAAYVDSMRYTGEGKHPLE